MHIFSLTNHRHAPILVPGSDLSTKLSAMDCLKFYTCRTCLYYIILDKITSHNNANIQITLQVTVVGWLISGAPTGCSEISGNYSDTSFS